MHGLINISIDNSLVVHELEVAIKHDLYCLL